MHQCKEVVQILLKKSMLVIDKELGFNVEFQMLMQVHDELIFEIKQDKLEKYHQAVIDIMQNVVKLKVPLLVDSAYAYNWSDAH